jgi:hypothetical protein
MTAQENFVGLSQKLDLIERQYAHLVQVQNLSSQMVQVAKGRYMMGRTFALIEPNNQITQNLINKGVLLVIETPVAKHKKSSTISESESLKEQSNQGEIKPDAPAQERKSRKKIAKEQKAKVDELGSLFKTDNASNIRQIDS